MAERAVKTVKESFLTQMLHDVKYNAKRSLQHHIDSFSFVYRNTPHSTTRLIPSKIIFKFKPKTHLSLLKPHLTHQMEIKQEGIAHAANQHRGKARSFQVNENVYVRTVRQEKINWQPGTITNVVSPVTYLASVDGRTRIVHADHLKIIASEPEEDDEIVQFPSENFILRPQGKSEALVKSPQPSPNQNVNTLPSTPSPRKPPAAIRPTQCDDQPKEDTTLRRSERPRRVLHKLDL